MRYLIRHDSGECVEVHANTKTRAEALRDAECAQNGWQVRDTEMIPIPEDSLLNKYKQEARNGVR
jgi:hypothetical protein